MSESADSVHKVSVRSSCHEEEWGRVATVAASGSIAVAMEMIMMYVVIAIDVADVGVDKYSPAMAMGLSAKLRER